MTHNLTATRLVKAFGVGVLVAVASIAIGLAIKLAVATLYFRWVIVPREQASGSGGIGSMSVLVSGWDQASGSGGIGSMSVLVSGWELIAVGTIGFVFGLWWTLQR